jgi:hypothetical protein
LENCADLVGEGGKGISIGDEDDMLCVVNDDIVINELCCDLGGEEGGVASVSQGVSAMNLLGTLWPRIGLIGVELEETLVPSRHADMQRIKSRHEGAVNISRIATLFYPIFWEKIEIQELQALDPARYESTGIPRVIITRKKRYT